MRTHTQTIIYKIQTFIDIICEVNKLGQTSNPGHFPEFATFGEMLKYLRLRQQLTQLELSSAVGYSEAQINRLEKNRRLPDLTAIQALFIPALNLEEEPQLAEQLLALARAARQEPARVEPGQPGRREATALHNLPSPLSSFIGREREIAEVVDILSRSRLVTLTGPGGVGKTRLALQVCERVREAVAEYGFTEYGFTDGVCFVELAAVSEPEFVIQAVAASLGLHETPGRSLLETMTAFLNGRQILLALDNCEHLLEACTRLADELLRRTPGLKMLVTSRERLGIGGENVYRVPPLAWPDPLHLPPLGEFLQVEAVQLLLERARAVLPALQIDEQNAPSFAKICARLDGIPLALELAAARLSLLTPEQIAARLDDAFQLLNRGSRTALPHQQTLRSAIEWSYNLLSAREQCLLRRLAVFAGGGGLEAIEAVCAGGELARDEILDGLDGLADKSMLTVERQPGEVRYRLLETVRQYAHEKLVEAGEQETFYRQHLAYFLELAERLDSQLVNLFDPEFLAIFEREIDNLRAGMGWAYSGENLRAGEDGLAGKSPHSSELAWRVEAGLRLAIALRLYWIDKLYCNEGCSWLEKGLSILPGDEAHLLQTRAIAYNVYSNLLWYRPFETEYVVWLAESIELFRKIGDTAGLVMAQSYQGYSLALRGDLEQGRAICEQGLAVARGLDRPKLLAEILILCNQVTRFKGEYLQANQLANESLRLFKELGDALQVGRVYLDLGTNDLQLGEYAIAADNFRNALDIFQTQRFQLFSSLTLGMLGVAACMQDEFAQMETCFRRSLEEIQDRELPYQKVWILRGIGCALKRQGKISQSADCNLEGLLLAEEAGDLYGVYAAIAGIGGAAIWSGMLAARGIRLLGATAGLFASFFKPLDDWEQREFERDLEAGREALSEEDFQRAWAEGQRLSQEEAVREGMVVGEEIR